MTIRTNRKKPDFSLAVAIPLIILLPALALTLVGCGAQYTPTGTGVTGIDVNLPDGRTVTCVVASGGGSDCDWGGAR